MLQYWIPRTAAGSEPQYAGFTAAGTTSYPNAGIRDLDSMEFLGYGMPGLVAFNEPQGFAYLVTLSFPAQILKVLPERDDQPPRIVSHTTLQEGGENIPVMLLDEENGYLYLSYEEDD